MRLLRRGGPLTFQAQGSGNQPGLASPAPTKDEIERTTPEGLNIDDFPRVTLDPKGRDEWVIKGSDETWLVRKHGQARSTLYQPLAKSSPVPIEAYTGDRLVVMWWVVDPKTE